MPDGRAAAFFPGVWIVRHVSAEDELYRELLQLRLRRVRRNLSNRRNCTFGIGVEETRADWQVLI